MSKFEYVTVFISIVMALAVSEVLLGLGRLIRERGRVVMYWTHVAWMVLAIFAMTQHWWGTWSYEPIPFESYRSFLALLAPSLTFVVIGLLITPQFPIDGEIDLRAQFLAIRRWAAGLGAVLVLEFGVLRTAVLGDPVFSIANLVRLLIAGSYTWAAAISDPKVERAAPYGAVILLAFFLLLIGFD